MEALSGFSAFGVFLAIAAIGFILLLVSLVFGEAFEHFGDGHFDVHGDAGGPGFFSVRIISVFVTAFGAFGAVATRYGLGPLPASGVGVASGIVFGGAIYAFARFLYGQQSTTHIISADLVGQTGRVVVAIPAGGLGQVRCRMHEELVDKIARSRDGAPIAENTAVVVKEVLGETVVVEKQ